MTGRLREFPGLPAKPPELVPARMINETLYCERLMYLEWAQGEFADNYFTVDGRFAHRRADEEGGKLPPKPAEGEGADAGESVRARSVWLSSEDLGITARIDIVEGDASGQVVPIEYKRGKRPNVPEGAYLPERAQVCAQVLLLREHGYRCDEGAIYFARDHHRTTVEITEDLIATTRAAIARARQLTSAGVMPPPLVGSPKCVGCSLSPLCLPEETHALARPPEAGALAEATSTAVRRLHPARDDRLPLYVQEHGARIGLTGDRLSIKSTDGAKQEVRINNTSQVSIVGNAQITTQAMRTLLRRGIPVSFFTNGGWFVGRATGHSSNNIELRVAQHEAARDSSFCLTLAKTVVRSKIRNSRTILRRNLSESRPPVLFSLKQLARKVTNAANLGELLGLEGSAARDYFQAFPALLKPGADDLTTFDFSGRNRRPPRDPVNALLSLSYALLTKDVVHAVSVVGLDPLLGFYHQPRFGRPALALDLMEEFRPIIADSVVIALINNRSVQRDDFRYSPVGVALRPAARKRLFQAYENRMDHLVTHPIFGYRISYRRVLEVQARLFSRLLLGEIDGYPAFETR